MSTVQLLQQFPNPNESLQIIRNTSGETVIDCPSKPQQMRYNEEAVRLESFRNWSFDFIDKRKLAQYGFYSMGQADTVKCHFCRVEIGQWDFGDNVLREHMRWSPYCPLLKRQSTDNVPLDANALNSSLPPPTFDICGNNEIEMRPGAYPESDPPPSYTVNHPDYTLESDRMKSFEHWPKAIKQKPKELSEAGFFYIGKGDQVKCFSCNGGLKDWEEDDDPWEQHAIWYSKCHYLNLIKGEQYVERVKSANDNTSTSSSSGGVGGEDVPPQHSHQSSSLSTSSSSSGYSSDILNSQSVKTEKLSGRDLSNLDDTKLCKICFNDELNTALFPCMHIITCAKCAVALTNCPICRVKITEIKRIYFS